MNKKGIIAAIILILLFGCTQQEKTVEKPRELLIYCGITMIRPMSELAYIFEKQKKCKITITKGGSGNLLKSIEVNKVGDLYLPGSDSYIKLCNEKEIINKSVHVGFNRAVMMVAPGNPKNIKADLMEMVSPKNYVVLGNPDSGSIGKETKKILLKRKIFDLAVENVKSFATDSKDLLLAIKNKKADLTINWYATSTWDNNKNYVQVLPIDSQYASPKKLVLGLLKYSKHPELAQKFMQLAASEQGKQIFQKYGLYNIEQ